MSPIEKSILNNVSDLTNLICEIGNTQADITKFLFERFPDSDLEFLLNASKNTQLKLQALQQTAVALKSALK